MQKILIITGDGGEGFETLYAQHRFLEAGYAVDIASTTRKRMHLVMHDFEAGWDTYVERQGYGVEANLAFTEVNVADYLAVVIPGGRAPEFLRHHAQVKAIVRAFADSGKWVWAICHGIQILITAGVLQPGMNVTCYEHCRSEAESTGAVYVADQQAVRDGKIVTGQTWQSHPEFYRAVFACLQEDTKNADAVHGA